MSREIKFNVIIPTRERADTLLYSLRTIVAQDYENLNIIVSDNFSQDNTKGVVDSFADPRIKYINTGKRISMSHNWEFALSHANEGWVMFLGDDDGLCPGALQLLNKLIQQHKVEAISTASIYFQWPAHFESGLRGLIVIPLTNSVAIKNSREEIKKVFSGTLSYTRLPWLYHGGAASLSLVNRLRDKDKRFFCSLNPDIYSAVALSLATDRFLSIQIPIAINGASKHSTGNSSMSSSVAKVGAAAKLFASEENIPFHGSLVLGKSLQIMLYECYLQSWHIHKGDLDIALLEQLSVAAKIAPKEHRQAILKDCHAIALMNDLTFVGQVDQRFSKVRAIIWQIVARFRLAYLRPWTMESSALNVKNVHEASFATWGIYIFITKDAVSKHTYLIARLVARVIAKIQRITS